MRYSSLFALCLGLLGCLLAPQTAEAQAWTDGECTVSLWWPYSRDAGDCLTDAERLAGATGTYRDPDGVLMHATVATIALRDLEGCEAVPAPEPLVGRISERMLLEGGADVRITITGVNFRCNSQAYFNAVPMPTNVLSATQLQMTVPLELGDREGDYPIVVRNRAPILQRAGGPQTIPTEIAGQNAPVPASTPERPAITNERASDSSVSWWNPFSAGNPFSGDGEAETTTGEPGPDPSTISPVPASSISGGGLLDDIRPPLEQRN